MEIALKILLIPCLIWLWTSPFTSIVFGIVRIFKDNTISLMMLIGIQIFVCIYLSVSLTLYGEPKGNFFSSFSIIHIWMLLGLGIQVLSIVIPLLLRKRFQPNTESGHISIPFQFIKYIFCYAVLPTTIPVRTQSIALIRLFTFMLVMFSQKSK